MELNDLFDQKTLEAILADAAEAGIEADEVEKVLRTLPNGGKSEPPRGANPEGELMSLMGDDKDAVTASVADAAGVDRSKTSTILMLAAPFLLKYLLGNNNSGSSSASLLGSLLGMGAQSQQSSMGSLLGALMGGGVQQPQTQNLTTSLLGSLLGGGTQQQTAYSTNNTASLLGSLLGGGQTAQAQSQNSMGSLLNLMGGAVQQSQQTQQPQQAGGLLNSLFSLFGDM